MCLYISNLYISACININNVKYNSISMKINKIMELSKKILRYDLHTASNVIIVAGDGWYKKIRGTSVEKYVKLLLWGSNRDNTIVLSII